MLQFQISYHNDLKFYRNQQLAQLSWAKLGSDPMQIPVSRTLFCPIRIMPQISIEDSDVH